MGAAEEEANGYADEQRLKKFSEMNCIKEEEHWAFSDEEEALSLHRREGALSVH